MAYSWAGHIKRVARLLHQNGSGWTKTLYAEDQFGRRLWDADSEFAVKWSLIGAMYKAYYQEKVFDRRWSAEEKQDYMRTLNKRMEILLHLLYKAGLPKPASNSVATMCLIHFERNAKWKDIENLLRDAYKIALRTENGKSS